MKRVVTGHSPDGKSIFLSTEEPPRTYTTASETQWSYAWKTRAPVIVPSQDDDPTLSMQQGWPHMLPSPGETTFLYITMPGNSESPMHATNTVDYGVVISGESWLILDDGAEIHLTAGDCVVQNGTRHAWQIRSPEPCTIAFILIGATREK